MKKTGFSEITDERLYYQGNDPWYCEIAITGQCNFHCTYCNRFKNDINMDMLEAFILNNQFKHIQITGGEPSIHPDFQKIMNLCQKKTIHLGLSTNGSAPIEIYKTCGADMFSISLDDYDVDILTKRGYQNPEYVISVIQELSKEYYVNIGLVVDSLNVGRIEDIIAYILALGVADIKLSISTKDDVTTVFSKDYFAYPILNYRVQNFKQGLPMRGFPAKKCYIVKNDITIVGDSHYPCLVYFREGGNPIGKLSSKSILERIEWTKQHDCLRDPICSKYCMDFKCEFNHAKELNDPN
jgi:organic radical activating enzyme